ncbi:serine-rich adhesin for platelets isoform X3 [Drosophila bipectinata]|nr:uncharacterized protein LOC108126859 isoform X3 [Drosophila bipectinata]XP_043069550.1 uncharacterized protein LOC108126859 isoform X3 [Drosophila bipectinata]
MLQPRKIRRAGLNKLHNKTHCRLHLMDWKIVCHKKWLILIIAIMSMESSDASPELDHLHSVSPTPLLPDLKNNDHRNPVNPTNIISKGGADDITTVILLNNDLGRVGDTHGRFLKLRPEVGLLTSTARTFIQNGITTEFATKIVGTELNNGRLYAQYLKKRSRVLYKNDNPSPAVLTSWVGEKAFQQSPQFLQSHNDLFNMDANVWQHIDDNLEIKKNDFIGNTDFVNVQSTKLTDPIHPSEKDANRPVFLPEEYGNNHKRQSIHVKKEELNTFKSVQSLSVEDLETFTVKNHNIIFSEVTIASNNSNHDINYSKNLHERYGKNVNSNISEPEDESISKIDLSTVTYYGFAEFTTMVGDSVIVFLPSTLQANQHFGHVTSIRGVPTLGSELVQTQISHVVKNTQILVNKTSDLERMHEEYIVSSENVPIFSSVSPSLDQMVDEKILLKNSINQNIDTEITLSSKNVTSVHLAQNTSINIGQYNFTIKEMKDPMHKLSYYHQNPSSEQALGGATTIFLDDDPFTKYIAKTDLTYSSLNVQPEKSSVKVANKMSIKINEHFVNANKNEIILKINSTKSNNIKENYTSCDHTTSQVFFTQMAKLLSDMSSLAGDDVIRDNPIANFDIIETTKYYCIQASQVQQTTDLVEINNISNIQIEPHRKSKPFDVNETTSLQTEYYDFTNENEYEGEDDEYEVPDDFDFIYKTFFTTYTYLTTFFEGSESTISSHTEIITNLVSSKSRTEEEFMTQIFSTAKENEVFENKNDQSNPNISHEVSKYSLPKDLVNILVEHNSSKNISEIKKITQATENLDDWKYTKTFYTTYTYYTSIFSDNNTEIMSRTDVITSYVTSKPFNNHTYIFTEPNHSNSLSIAETNEITTSTNIIKNDKFMTSSYNISNDFLYQEDQVSSESNTEEIIPSATLLLQTSFTTFTFYTTMYVGNDTNIVSRLETVTNIATGILQPSKTLQGENVFPVTYFTTFTYWTKLAKDGEISTISREETLSNIVSPTNISQETVYTSSSKISKNKKNQDYDITTNITDVLSTLHQSSDFVTYYTTYTYYTTSYEGNETFTDSRFETSTNVVTSNQVSLSTLETEFAVPQNIYPSTKNLQALSTSENQLVLFDFKKIIDADEVSTLYFTTEILSKVNDDGFSIEITSSTSRLKIDESKKKFISSTSINNGPDETSSISRLHKTGLLRIIEGKRIQNNTTTVYQSKVIGTVISNRYAQVIESTSSFLYESTFSDNFIFPTKTTAMEYSISTNEITTLSQSSKNYSETIIENLSSQNDEYTDPLQTLKRTFAPVIRPFASRNRPTFAPKQKNQISISATIITRSDITPTITATPALKIVGKYSSSRRGAFPSALKSPNDSSFHQSHSTKRFFGRPSKLTTDLHGISESNTVYFASRNRFSSSLHATQNLSTKRQDINISHRPTKTAFWGSSILSNIRIRPNSSLSNGGLPTQILAHDDFSLDSSIEEGNSTEVSEELESTKRNQNQLLRLRRPVNRPSGFIASTKNLGNTPVTSFRRNPLLARSKFSTTTSTTTTTVKPSPRSFPRPIGLQARSRSQSNLFPPRGLFQPQQKEEHPIDIKNANFSENSFELDSEHGYDKTENSNGKRHRNKRSSKILRCHTRRRRQSEAKSRNPFRFRRQNSTISTPREEGKQANYEELEESNHSLAKTTSRFGSRFHSPRGNQMHSQGNSFNSTIVITHNTIRPTRPSSKRPQFTLRENENSFKSNTRSGSQSNFRRQSGNASTRRPISSNQSSSSTNKRIKSYNNYNNKNNGEYGRLPHMTRSRNINTNTSKRGRGSVRSRTRGEYASDFKIDEQEEKIITVTHFIPSEVTVPFINGYTTDYKNIITAKTSTELVGPNQYTNVVGNNGLTSLYLKREESKINDAGFTEHTKYLLHESITSTVTFTPTTIRGRKTSFSHILPSTGYSVEYLVSTIQPQISANAPLANILLSQLLLGNLNLPAHHLNGQQQNFISPVVTSSAEPITEYRTHTSTYVTTIFDGKSTILPITFQGKKILTTVYDTTAQTITATEYSVDTIVNTPSMVENIQSNGPAAVNSLLLQQLLLQQQQEPLSLPPILLKTETPQITQSENFQDLEVTRSNVRFIDDVDYIDIPSNKNTMPMSKNSRKKEKKGSHGRKRSRHNELVMNSQDASVITLYVSGRRPGEFSTVLSTVQNTYDRSASLQKRHIQTTIASKDLKKNQDAKELNFLMNTLPCSIRGSTTSLEDTVGDVSIWLETSSKKLKLFSMETELAKINSTRTYILNI